MFFASPKLSDNPPLSDGLTSDITATAASTSGNETGRIDISDMMSRCGFDAASLLSMSICPALSTYREMIGVPESSDGIFDSRDFSSYFPSSITSSDSITDCFTQQCSISDAHIESENFDYGVDDDNDDNDEIDFGDDIFGDFPPPTISSARKSTVGIAFNRRSSIGGLGKIQWDTVPVPDNSTSQTVCDPTTPKGKDSLGSSGTGSSNSVVWDAAGITCSNEYSFFDMDLVNKSNSWAGARHWKYANRRQAQTTPVEISDDNRAEGILDEESESVAKKIVPSGRSNKGPKEKFVFDFLSPLPSQESFAVPKSRSKGNDKTCMTAAALEKDMLFQKEGGLFLPPDAKLQTSDLCRLMLSHRIIVPPPMLAHVFIKQAASSSSKKGEGKNIDIIWGQVRRVSQTNGMFQLQANVDYDDGDDDNDFDDGDFGEDFCDPEMDDINVNVNNDQKNSEIEVFETPREGLQINAEGLLKASRKVDKIDIG